MIRFNKIENGDIFTRDFRPLVKNNEVRFSSKGIAVIYGPNGTGKTSLIRAIAGDKNSHIEFEYAGDSFTSGESVFHIINDQNSRNIISGEAKDFLLGDNIRREFELHEEILKERQKLTTEAISKLKQKHGISSSSNPLIDIVEVKELQDFIKDLSNNRSKGEKYNIENFVNIFSKFNKCDVNDSYSDKAIFLKSDYVTKESIIRKIESINVEAFPHNSSIAEVEENTEALNILNKFLKNQCVVCDTENINRVELIARKTDNRNSVLNSLGEELKSFIENIIGIAPDKDPFGIKETLLHAIECGDKEVMKRLKNEIFLCKRYMGTKC